MAALMLRLPRSSIVARSWPVAYISLAIQRGTISKPIAHPDHCRPAILYKMRSRRHHVHEHRGNYLYSFCTSLR